MFFIPVFKLQSRSQSFRIFNLNLNLPLCLNVQTVPRLICVKSSCTGATSFVQHLGCTTPCLYNNLFVQHLVCTTTCLYNTLNVQHLNVQHLNVQHLNEPGVPLNRVFFLLSPPGYLLFLGCQ